MDLIGNMPDVISINQPIYLMQDGFKIIVVNELKYNKHKFVLHWICLRSNRLLLTKSNFAAIKANTAITHLYTPLIG